jgi:hypothetical protein
MRQQILACGLIALLGALGPARADPPPASVRVTGEIAGAADPVPARFVLDLRLAPGASDFQSEVSGWFAALPPTVASGAVDGSCVRRECAVSADLDAGKLEINGDLAAPAASSRGRFALTDADGKTLAKGELSLAPLAGPVADLGPLAPPGAVSRQELRELLLWSDIGQGFDNVSDFEPGDIERDGLAGWQQSLGRPMTGLIFAADLVGLRAHAAATKSRVGWTELSDKARGWRAGYPLRLMPQASQDGGRRRFGSGDGKATLSISVDPALDDDGFDHFVDQHTAGQGRANQSYARVNDEFVISYNEGGSVVSAAYYNRKRGLFSLEFRRPASDDADYELFDQLEPESFKVDADPDQ